MRHVLDWPGAMHVVANTRVSGLVKALERVEVGVGRAIVWHASRAALTCCDDDGVVWGVRSCRFRPLPGM